MQVGKKNLFPERKYNDSGGGDGEEKEKIIILSTNSVLISSDI